MLSLARHSICILASATNDELIDPTFHLDEIAAVADCASRAERRDQLRSGLHRRLSCFQRAPPRFMIFET